MNSDGSHWLDVGSIADVPVRVFKSRGCPASVIFPLP